jgi:xanthine/uracil permease
MSRENVENDPQTETLDFLIEQSRRLFEVYEARRSTAETKIAGVVTAAVALATITVTATITTHLERVFASVVLGCVVLTVLVALLARLAVGLQLGEGPLLSSESKASRARLSALHRCQGDESPARVREGALKMWRARERDSHNMARAKERGAGAAGILLGLALICDGVLGYLLLAGTG